MSSSGSTEVTLAMMRQSLYSAVVCDALDAMGYRNQSPRVPLHAFTVNGMLVGRCKTTLWADMYDVDPRPYELELKAVDTCRVDEVIIAAASGSVQSALWGELLSTAARNSGCVGAIIDGAVRDVRQMSEMGFPIFARGKSTYDSLHRQRVIDLDVVVEIAGVRFCPGDLVFADIDGIVVVPQAVEAEAMLRAWNKVHSENLVRDSIRSGMKATQVFEKFGIL